VFTWEISSRDEFVPVSGQSSYVAYTLFLDGMKSHPCLRDRDENETSPWDEIR